MKLLIYIFTLLSLTACNFLTCSGDKLSETDLLKINRLNKEFHQFTIYPDDCFPLGYINLSNRDWVKIDTMQIFTVLDRSIEMGIQPDRIQVFNSNGIFMFVAYIPESGKHEILTPGDF